MRNVPTANNLAIAVICFATGFSAALPLLFGTAANGQNFSGR
jgi:hypothetical protein